MSCKCVPVYNVTAVSIDTTTGVATITTDAPTPQAGRFDLRWRLCCQQLSPCWTETLNITLGTAARFAAALEMDFFPELREKK